MVAFVPTLKSLDADKKSEKTAAPAETAPAVEEKIDFSKVKIEPLFEDSAVHHEDDEEKLHLLMVDPHIPAGAKLY